MSQGKKTEEIKDKDLDEVKGGMGKVFFSSDRSSDLERAAEHSKGGKIIHAGAAGSDI